MYQGRAGADHHPMSGEANSSSANRNNSKTLSRYFPGSGALGMKNSVAGIVTECNATTTPAPGRAPRVRGSVNNTSVPRLARRGKGALPGVAGWWGSGRLPRSGHAPEAPIQFRPVPERVQGAPLQSRWWLVAQKGEGAP